LFGGGPGNGGSEIITAGIAFVGREIVAVVSGGVGKVDFLSKSLVDWDRWSRLRRLAGSEDCLRTETE